MTIDKEIGDSQRKKDPLTEKAFLRSVVISVISVIFCMVALSSATWAWFRAEVSSAANTILTGSYELSVSVTDGSAPLAFDRTPEGYYRYALAQGGSYTVTLSSDGTGSNGYCRILTGGRTYYTGLVTVGDAQANPCSFSITVSEDADVLFDLRWGTYSGENDVSAGGTLEITIS